MNTIDLLDAVRRRHHLPSDYAAAKLLGLTPQQLSKYRNGKDYPGDDAAMKIAEALQIDAGWVLACVHADRAENGPARLVWEGIAARLKRAGLAAVVAVLAVVCVGVAPSPADARTLEQGGVCILCQMAFVAWLQRFAAWLARLAPRGNPPSGGLQPA